jgi:hypothetical protein
LRLIPERQGTASSCASSSLARPCRTRTSKASTAASETSACRSAGSPASARCAASSTLARRLRPPPAAQQPRVHAAVRVRLAVPPARCRLCANHRINHDANPWAPDPSATKADGGALARRFPYADDGLEEMGRWRRILRRRRSGRSSMSAQGSSAYRRRRGSGLRTTRTQWSRGGTCRPHARAGWPVLSGTSRSPCAAQRASSAMPAALSAPL